MTKYFIYLLIISIFSLGCKPLAKVKEKLSSSRQKESKIEDLRLAESLVWPKPVEISFQRDPFKPLTGIIYPKKELTEQEVLDLTLKGVLLSDKKIALIRSPQEVYIVKEGDKIGKDILVKEIYKNKVILDNQGKLSVLKMEEVK